jgi:hypothetical protein
MGRFGAMMPDWTIGITAAGTAFVNQAEEYIRKNSLMEADLRQQIDRIKNREVILTEWLTPEQYLEQKYGKMG